MKFAYFLALWVSFCALRASGQCNLATNLAAGRPGVASSLENASYPASYAFDGDMTTRWSSAYSDPQTIYVDLGAVYSLCQVALYWENAYATSFTIDVSNNASTWTTVATVTGNTSTTNNVSISASARYVRMTGLSRATMYGYSLYEFQVFGTAGSCGASNLALNQPATASSLENAGDPASSAFDGSMTTRWSSAFSDPQYIYVDLGAVYPLCQVALFWEAAYATSFNIDVSNNATSWTTVASVTGNTSTTNHISITGSGRYVRMYGNTRATSYGYSLYEFQVFGPITLPVQLNYFKAVNEDNTYVNLEWATGSERNNDHFDVERSGDGATYTTIESVPGQDNSNLEQDYQIKDMSPLDGPNYYRLKQVDNNGQFVYSTVAFVRITHTEGVALSVYPNPVSDFVQVTGNAASGELIRQVNLYSVTGVKLSSFNNASGIASTQIACSQLTPGVYLLEVRTNREVKVFKLIK